MCVYLFIVQGMVEPGQVVTQALKAEFGEEAMAKLSVTDEEREKISILVERLFKEGVEVSCCSNDTRDKVIKLIAYLHAHDQVLNVNQPHK